MRILLATRLYAQRFWPPVAAATMKALAVDARQSRSIVRPLQEDTFVGRSFAAFGRSILRTRLAQATVRGDISLAII